MRPFLLLLLAVSALSMGLPPTHAQIVMGADLRAKMLDRLREFLLFEQSGLRESLRVTPDLFRFDRFVPGLHEEAAPVVVGLTNDELLDRIVEMVQDNVQGVLRLRGRIIVNTGAFGSLREGSRFAVKIPGLATDEALQATVVSVGDDDTMEISFEDLRRRFPIFRPSSGVISRPSNP